MTKKKILKFFCFSFILMFLFFYCIEKSGYYEYNLREKTTLTNDAIKSFEEDVANGKDVDITKYLEETNVDYSNSITRTTSNIILKLNDFIKYILINGFDIFDVFFK